MGAEISTLASGVPTSDRTYGDTGQLLGLTPKQPNQGVPPTTMPYTGLDTRVRAGASSDCSLTFVLVFHFAGRCVTPFASSEWPGLNVVAGTRDTRYLWVAVVGLLHLGGWWRFFGILGK